MAYFITFAIALTLLGHSNTETTENYYISSTENSKIKATNAFEEMTHSEIINDIIKYDIF